MCVCVCVCVCVYLCAYLCVCVCVCVCLRERDIAAVCCFQLRYLREDSTHTLKKTGYQSHSKKMITIFLLEKNGISSREYLVGEHKGLSY